MAEQGDKIDSEQWLDADREDEAAFGTRLAGKLKDFTGTGIGPACNLHYQNVRIAYTHLYGFDMEGVGANASLVTRSGNQGNIAELRIPAAAGLLRKAFNIVVGPELTWSAVATTTDFASESQAITARNALEYYWKHENMGVECKATKFESMSFAEGALHIPWDTNLGEDVGVEGNSIVKSGGIRLARISTWDMMRDPTAKRFGDIPWSIHREWPSKFDVAAPFKDNEDPLVEAKYRACMSAGASPPLGQAWLPFRTAYNANTDRIPVYYLYCKRIPSVPQGRQTVFLEDGTVISDGPLDKRYCNQDGSCVLPLVRTASGEYAGTPWPYTKFFGILGSDQARDALRRDLLTNATATSGNVLAVPEAMMDAGASVAFQTGGPQLLPIPEGSTGEIKVLQLQQSHPEHFKLLQTLGNEEQQIMGIDNITAGQDIGANLSGAAMALMTSTSVQNNSQDQSEWVDFVMRCGNVVLKHVQNMQVPKQIALAGNARSSLVTTTKVDGDAVAGIERVLVTIGSPLQQTDAGRYQIATEALKNQWVQTPEQFQTVLDTGRLDALTEDLSNELLLIKSENEKLAKGAEVVVMLEDNHRLHIKGHASVMSSVMARDNPAAVQAVQAHNDKHIRALRETDPALLQLLGQQPLTPVAAPGGPPPPGAPPPGPKPPQAAQHAEAPSMPTNPATGQKAAPVAGAQPPALAIRPS
jgi:hypothetical protein